MNKSDFFISLIGLLSIISIYLICYFFIQLVCTSVKYRGEKKVYFNILITSILCLSLFIIYGLLDNYFDVKIKFLQPLWFLAVPIYFLLFLISGIFFISKKNKSSQTKDG